MDKRFTLPIAKIIEETATVKTYTFKHKLDAKPGQFIMLTDFEGGEKPFSISDCTSDGFSITVKKIGEFTTRIFCLREGDYMSIRGAFGSSFFVSEGKVLLVGGGYAVPIFYFLSKILLKNEADVTVVNCARTKDDLLFVERFKKLGVKLYNGTEDGSFGESGTAGDVAERLLKKEKFDFLYSSGPDLMMKALQKVIGNIDYEFCFERYMKCAVGICGSCTMDPLGIRLCVEGPVLPKNLVEQLTEFGKYHRDVSGERVKF